MKPILDLRIHHFFDIIRDFGAGKEIKPHPHDHSLHKIAALIKKDPYVKFRLVIKCDAACRECIHMVNGHCEDIITYRKDFTSKEEFNNFIDKRIMGKYGLNMGDITTPILLIKKAQAYLDNIFFIYDGNDIENTKRRKKNVIRGIKLYTQWHKLRNN
jgi:hypothetical protein